MGEMEEKSDFIKALEFDYGQFWEQRRFEAAMAAMQGLLSNQDIALEKNEAIAQLACANADALIVELRKNERCKHDVHGTDCRECFP